MTKTNRDEFTDDTRQLIAKRSGYICSYPNCKRMTVAMSSDRASGLTMTGVAAHITAASSDGPRYDKNMSSDQRKSVDNGLWTCQNHGKFIDDNESTLTVAELHRIKSQHENWVFERVESGNEIVSKGLVKIGFSGITPFKNEHNVSISRINVLVGDSNEGVNSFCRVVSALSNKVHFDEIYDKVLKNELGIKRVFIESIRLSDVRKRKVRLTIVKKDEIFSKLKSRLNRIHIEVDEKPSIDWPRHEINAIYFKDQLHYSLKTNDDIFKKCIKYLISIFETTEDILWDSLREEFFHSSVFGYKIKRTGYRKIDVLVPDGRDFYLPHHVLSCSEMHFLFIEIAMALYKCHKDKGSWIFIFDWLFFERMDGGNKVKLFKAFSNMKDENIQAIFCLRSSEDAELLRDVESDNWVNATTIEDLTLHSFI